MWKVYSCSSLAGSDSSDAATRSRSVRVTAQRALLLVRGLCTRTPARAPSGTRGSSRSAIAQVSKERNGYTCVYVRVQSP